MWTFSRIKVAIHPEGIFKSIHRDHFTVNPDFPFRWKFLRVWDIEPRMSRAANINWKITALLKNFSATFT